MCRRACCAARLVAGRDARKARRDLIEPGSVKIVEDRAKENCMSFPKIPSGGESRRRSAPLALPPKARKGAKIIPPQGRECESS
jgi:hypothetical protein